MKLLKNVYYTNVYDTDHFIPQRVCQIPGPAWNFNLIITTIIASKIETSANYRVNPMRSLWPIVLVVVAIAFFLVGVVTAVLALTS